VEEIAIAERVGGVVKTYIGKQTEHLTELNKELDLFRKTFNKRVKYFAALQEISDSVSACVSMGCRLVTDICRCRLRSSKTCRGRSTSAR
jgi:hypothetical protein